MILQKKDKLFSLLDKENRAHVPHIFFCAEQRYDGQGPKKCGLKNVLDPSGSAGIGCGQKSKLIFFGKKSEIIFFHSKTLSANTQFYHKNNTFHTQPNQTLRRFALYTR